MSAPQAIAIAVVAVGVLTPAVAAEPVHLYAAGSLRPALSEIATAFEASHGDKVAATFGASGLLKDQIVAGAPADVFASANLEHPRALAEAKRAAPVVLFARNRLCALVRAGLTVEPATVLDRMLDPAVKLGTSSPRADPSGDYAWAVFRRADALRPGALAALETKALQLTGGPSSPVPPPGRTVYGMLLEQGAADLFLTYCTTAVAARAENPAQQVVVLPDALAVGADYGLTVMRSASPAAYQFALFILSAEGQRILARHGFAVPNLPE